MFGFLHRDAKGYKPLDNPHALARWFDDLPKGDIAAAQKAVVAKLIEFNQGLRDYGKARLQILTTRGALPLLQRISDNDVDRPAGTVIYTQFLNTRGGVEAHVTITRVEADYFRIVTGSNFIGNDLGLVRMGIRPDDPPVEIRDVTEEYAVLGLWGPRARDLLQAISTSDLSNAALPYKSAKSIEVRGAPVYAQRVTYVGELGWELYIPYAWAMQVWDAVWAEGQTYNIQPGGYPSRVFS